MAGKDVSVLINNVGESYPSALYFSELEEHSPGAASRLIDMNLRSTVETTQVFLKGMLDRKRGAVVNISSAAGRVPIGNPL
jgi:17beta-estradiol 17-dehydrogenase / very-long-chain 3-oxoacyl-CoA reductase